MGMTLEKRGKRRDKNNESRGCANQKILLESQSLGERYFAAKVFGKGHEIIGLWYTCNIFDFLIYLGGRFRYVRMCLYAYMLLLLFFFAVRGSPICGI